MKKLVLLLFLAAFFLLPINAVATYLYTDEMTMSAYTADGVNWNGWYTGYRGTIDGLTQEIFCVENADGYLGTTTYDFFSIDQATLGDKYTDIIKAVWFAEQYARGTTISGGEGDFTVNKLIAQVAIWETMFDPSATRPAGVTDLINAYDGADYSSNWLLAVSPANYNTWNNDEEDWYIDWSQNYQNYLVPNTAPVPEPATMLLLGTGLIGLAGMGRKKFRK